METENETNRFSELRKMNHVDHIPLLTPFLYMHPQYGYSVDSIYRKINSQPKLHLGTYPNTFPNTIEEYFWISASSNLWKALGTVNLNGSLVYFFYTAALNSEGSFVGKQKGVMNLWLSTRYADIIQFVMDTDTYIKYYVETNPIK